MSGRDPRQQHGFWEHVEYNALMACSDEPSHHTGAHSATTNHADLHSSLLFVDRLLGSSDERDQKSERPKPAAFEFSFCLGVGRAVDTLNRFIQHAIELGIGLLGL